MAVGDLRGVDAVSADDAPAVLVAPPPRGAQSTLRRIVVYTLLLVLVILVATGVSGLLGRLLETRPNVVDDVGGLALSLAFTLIAGPLALLLWWFAWRRLDGPDRSSVAWGVYVSAVSVVALVTATTGLLGALADLVGGTWSPGGLATGVTWLAVWLLHRRMWTDSRKGPRRLAAVPVVLGAAYALVLAAGGAIRALQAVVGEAMLPAVAHVGGLWWQSALQALVWALGGGAIWWWLWVRDRAVARPGGFPAVMLVLTGVLGAAAAAIGGLGSALHVGLRAAFDSDAPRQELLEPLPLAIAAAAVGSVVWLYHRRIAAERSSGVGGAARLVEAGLGLVAAATGIGVVVNALLATLSTPLAGSAARSLLLGGIAWLAVGAPLWWSAWRPRQPATATRAAGRRVYLVAVFGVSAVVALVALLIVGSGIFEVALDGAGGGLVERIRAPFGLLVATALVAGYHFAVWRHDRAVAPPSGRARSIDRVVLVTGGDPAALAAAIESSVGASVIRWARADAAPDGEPVPVEAVLAALEGVAGRRVLVVVGPGDRVQVVPLAD